jgi:hypothetical protein
MNRINILENKISQIILASPYDPLPVAKTKSIPKCTFSSCREALYLSHYR